MNVPISAVEKPTRVRYGVLGFACSLSMITYLDRVCFGTVASEVQREFGLSEVQQGWLFSAFAFAYAVFEVPSGWLGDLYGARRTLIRIVLWWSCFTALTGSIYPTPGSLLGFFLLLTVRFLFGMGEAGAYPNIARAFHSWFPFTERGWAKGTVWMAGRFAGGITAFLVYALMYDQHFAPGSSECTQRNQHLVVGAVAAGGIQPWSAMAAVGATQAPMTVTHWRHTFYIFGVMGVAWCMAWWWWYRDNPATKAGVNAAELSLIQHGEAHTHDKLVVPWRKLLGSANLWLLCAMYFCASYGWYLNITFFPAYLKDELGIARGDEKWTTQFWIAGLMAGLPLLVGSLGCLIGGLLTDAFIRRTGNRKWGRRLFGMIGHGLTACCFFVAIFFMKSPIFVLLIALASFWNDITMGAAWASCLDIGKRYSGIVAGCMNTVGNLGGTLAGVATGWILDLHTGTLQHGSEAYKNAKTQGWTLNIFLFGIAYVIAMLCWLRFDATKPVAPVEPTAHV